MGVPGQVGSMPVGPALSLADFLCELSFNLLGADVAPAADGRFHLKRPDGSAVTLLDHGPFALEWANTRLPHEERRLNAALRDLCAIPKMSTFTIGAIVNAAVSRMESGAAFVNVGVWHGYSFLAGLHDNRDARAIGIDDFSQFGGPRSDFLARFARASSDRHSFIEDDFRRALTVGIDDPIGVYLYDGPHSYEDQLDGLRLAEPFFADDCIVVVDDANWPPARRATFDFLAASPYEYSVLLDAATPSRHPTLWNGLLMLQRGGARDSPPVGISAPRLAAVESPDHDACATVAVLVDAAVPDALLRATLDSMAAQTHRDIELLAFGAELPGTVESYATAHEALAASESAYAVLLGAGVVPSENAVETALGRGAGVDTASRQPPARGAWAAGAERRRFLSGDLDGFRQRQRDFRRRFAATFGYEIRDPFDDVCTMLAAGEPFAYSRFGDGEFKAIFGVEGANCDGHRFFPDLGRRLAEVLESGPDYLLGLLPLAIRVHGIEPVLGLSSRVRWVLANSFPLALLESRLGSLFEALADRQVLLVGPEHLAPLAAREGWDRIVVASRDCWQEYDDVLRRLRESVPASNGVVLFCASMMTNVLIDDMHRRAPASSYVDVGSAFDPLCGVNSRLYHEALDPADLEALGRSA